MKTYKEITLLKFAPEQVVSVKPRLLYLRERVLDTHSMGGWVGSIAGLDVLENKKVVPPPGIESWLSGSLPVTLLRHPGPHGGKNCDEVSNVICTIF
jgi:hypothetical protein